MKKKRRKIVKRKPEDVRRESYEMRGPEDFFFFFFAFHFSKRLKFDFEPTKMETFCTRAVYSQFMLSDAHAHRQLIFN